MGHGLWVSDMRAGNSFKVSDIDALVIVPDRQLCCIQHGRAWTI
jgi:hypothetical protein